jgi:drug/metabolite transporter (DMT)-like permease
VLGIALAFVLLAERPSWVELVAGVVIVGGVLLGTPRPAPRRAERAMASTTVAT